MTPSPSGLHPVRLSSDQKPLICVNIDTEEDFDWAQSFSRSNTSTGSLTYLKDAHTILRRYAVKPTYLVDYPITKSRYAEDTIAQWYRDEECILGAQLHPWVTPPHREVICPQNSFPCNLDAPLEREKLRELTEAVEERFGTRPQIYKAGRYGISFERISFIEEAGYQVDTSVVPFRSYKGQGGGPDFFGMPDQPFWMEGHEILFLPVTQSLIGGISSWVNPKLARQLLKERRSILNLPGLLARLGVLERVMLSPEGMALADIRRLLRLMVRQGKRVFVLSFHSPSLKPGCTPYVRNDVERREFLRRIEAVLDFIFVELEATPTDLLALKERLNDNS